MANKNSLALPDNVFSLLAEADKRNGFPAGTMQSVMQQEIGGNNKFLQDPAAYHYGLNADGKRIAGHTGKVSTAFGPFGILESTAADPGFGVKPLQGKSLEEQVRFASDYLAARSKNGGGLSAGLAGYGEGTKYAEQVAGRLGVQGSVAAQAPVVAQATPTPTSLPAQYGIRNYQLYKAEQEALGMEVLKLPDYLRSIQQGQGAQTQDPVVNRPQAAAPDAWQEWNNQLQQAHAQEQASDMAYGGQQVPAPAEVQVPDFMAALGSLGQNRKVDFSGFGGFGMKARV